MSTYIICTGGRDFADRELVHEILSFLHAFYGDDLRVMHGAARGADTLVAEVCDELGIRVKGYPADWEAEPRRAGIIRNCEMVAKVVSWQRLGHFGQVVAFRGGNGTRHCANEAERRGLGVDYIPNGWNEGLQRRTIDVAGF